MTMMNGGMYIFTVASKKMNYRNAIYFTPFFLAPILN